METLIRQLIADSMDLMLTLCKEDRLEMQGRKISNLLASKWVLSVKEQ